MFTGKAAAAAPAAVAPAAAGDGGGDWHQAVSGCEEDLVERFLRTLQGLRKKQLPKVPSIWL